ncbi:hypothetical protein ONE63_003449 [Megalurothrips usitatus]|uniref:OTU domain-containing protein n=1 Tax=Megalurothrips usitatus TaxID=439358 RepID=A0AAV7X7A9_9NEOP|nr:hypothetical protein ONE63_003449 [Megalurothrips usitatus]
MTSVDAIQTNDSKERGGGSEHGDGTLRVRKMLADGHCLFSAATNQLFPELDVGSNEFMDLVKEYRKKVVSYLRERQKQALVREQLKVSVEASSRKYNQRRLALRIMSFLNHLEDGTEWGGGERFTYNPTDGLVKKEIAVVYRISLHSSSPGRNHYDSVITVRDTVQLEPIHEDEDRETIALEPIDEDEDRETIALEPIDEDEDRETIALEPIDQGEELNWSGLGSEGEEESGSESSDISLSAVEEYFRPDIWGYLSRYEKKSSTTGSENAKKRQRQDSVDSTYCPSSGDENSGDEVGKSSETSKESKEKPSNSTKPIRKFGKVLTPNTCMPSFSALAVVELKSQEPNMRVVLPEIGAHIEGILGPNVLPTKSEYNIISFALVSKYPALADPDNAAGYEKIKGKISASLREARKIKKRKIERGLEKLQGKDKPQVVIDSNDAASDSKAKAELKSIVNVTDTSPHILILIQKTMDIRTAEFSRAAENDDVSVRTSALKEIWKEYQFYENSRMVVEAQGTKHINTGQKYHSPCVLVVTDICRVTEKELPIKSYLKCFDIVVSELDRPQGAAEIAAQLLAMYFRAHIQYPPAYKSFLRLLEKMMMRQLCLKTARQKCHETYNKFLRATGSNKLKEVSQL